MNKISRQYQQAAKVVFLAAFFFTSNVQSSEFNVNPVRVYLDGKVRSGTVVVENKSDEILTIQTSINSWSQENGKQDLLVPTEDLIVSPPIFKVQPKSRQMVRVGHLKKPDANLEGAYRLILQEVPPPRKPGDTGMAVAIRMSLPVFIAPAAARTQAVLKWHAEAVDARSIRLTFSNSGTAHIQINGIRAVLTDGTHLAAIESMMTYVLPGQSHSIVMKTDKPWKSEPLRVMITSDTAPPGVETEVKPE
ncbi:MAG: fimbria/pilus periplasmic chaperone [Gallionella sp.]|nr:fimbria/pilus periplasmic chaperone [Gallionella sp.]